MLYAHPLVPIRMAACTCKWVRRPGRRDASGWLEVQRAFHIADANVTVCGPSRCCAEGGHVRRRDRMKGS